MSNFVQIQNGAFRAFVLPENLAKVEDKLAKVKPRVSTFPKPSARDRARVFPVYEPGMSVADYVSEYERKNSGLSFTKSYLGLNEYPAAQYDPMVPLCIEDANPDYIAGVDDAPVKPKRTRKAAKAMPDKSAVMWLLMDHGLTVYQANPLADKLLTLFGADHA